MGLFDFVKDAGERVFGGGDDDKPAEPQVRTQDMALADRAKGEALERLIVGMGVEVTGLDVQYRNSVVTVKGAVASQADKEKAILLVGNTQGISRVDDQMTVEKPEPEATMYTVKSGDTLGKIAKAHYGDAMKYPEIFEANKPLLKDPDKIYPGQVLRIPALD